MGGRVIEPSPPETDELLGQWPLLSDYAEQHAKLEAIFTSLAEGVVVQDREGRIIYCNPAAERILERPRAVLLGLESRDPIWQAIHLDGSEWPGETHPAMVSLRTGRPIANSVMGLRFEDGRVRWISINTQPILNLDQQAESVVASFSDISLLREQMQRLDLTISAAGIGTWDWNIVTGEVVFNEAWAAMLGYELSEIEPNVHVWERLVDKTASKQILAALESHLAGHTPYYRSEHRIRHKNGSWVWIIDTGRVVQRDSTGRPLRALGMHVDITALKEMEQRLRTSQAKFRVIFDQTFQLIGVLNTAGQLVEVNRAALELARLKETDVVGKAFEDTPWWSHSTVAQAKLRDGIRRAVRGEFVRFEAIYPASDEVVHHVDFSLKPVKDERNRIIALIAEGRDITDLVRVRESLRESQNRLTRATVCSNIGIWEWNPETDEAWFSEQWFGMLGYGPEELPSRGATWISLLHPEDVPHALAAVQKHVHSDESEYRVELRMRCKDGSYRWVHTIGQIVERKADGSPTRFSGVHIDITEQKDIERQLAQSQRMEAIGQLAAGVAHEINTPMQFVTDNLEFLGECVNSFQNIIDTFRTTLGGMSSLPAEKAQALKTMLERARYERRCESVSGAISDALAGCSRVISIVRAMGQMSRSSSDKLQPADLNEVIRNSTILSRNAWKMAAELSFDFQDRLPAVYCDAAELSQVFINLINNACDAIQEAKEKYPSRSGCIVFKTESTEPGHVTIRVCDNGMGVRPEHQSKIFDLFFTTKPVGKGTGQGLAISHQIITKKHNGSIRVESEFGVGTTFIIDLPVSSPTSHESAD